MAPISYSQAGQDRFPRYLVKKPSPDYVYNYLDIGSHAPTTFNNSYALEQEGWFGVSIDIEDFGRAFREHRKNPFLRGDATKMDWMAFFRQMYPGVTRLDYLSFDIDDATEAAFERFPWTEMRFSTITLEHDQYRVGTRLRDKIRGVLGNLGYQLVCADVIVPGYGAFEDWFVDPNPNHVQMEHIPYIKCDQTPYASILSLMDQNI